MIGHNRFLFLDPCGEKVRRINWLLCSTNNMPEKQKIKLDRKVRELYRTVYYRVESESTRCPLCVDNYYVVLSKKINQHKFKFHCMKCKFSYMVVIQSHEILCGNCNGSGINRILIKPDIGKPYFATSKCKICNGNGRLDWVSRVTKAKGIS